MKVFNKTYNSMGTRFDLVLFDNESVYCEDVASEIFNLLQVLNDRFNRFDPFSTIAKINQHASKCEFPVDDDTFEIISESIHYNKLTYGYFDITITPLLELWQVKHGRKSGDYIPSEDEIEKIKLKTGSNYIHLDEKKKVVWFSNPEIKIDLGAVAKGYALQKINILLDCNNISNAFISFGGSSVLGKGHHPLGDTWKTGIINPFEPQKILFTVDLHNQSFSTSGFNPDFTKSLKDQFSHIINPVTGKSDNSNRLITVVSDSPVISEVLSTALNVSPSGVSEKIIKNFSDIIVYKTEYDNDKEVWNTFRYNDNEGDFRLFS